MPYYFDNASTTPINKEVLEAMNPWLSSDWGNPSSKYLIGRKAHKAVSEARRIVAESIGADPNEIFFTSSGSEANTWAIQGLYCIRSGKVLSSPIEHHSVLNSINSNGIEAEYIDTESNGVINTNSLITKIKHDTPLIATMMVNNEIGTIQPIADIAKICETEGIFFHVDAVQAFGHIPICVHGHDVPSLSTNGYNGITSLSISGHKIGAPKGIGALYIRKDAQQFYSPLIYGGQQESGMRGGTENVPYIVGFAKACELAVQKLECSWAVRKLSSYIWDFLNANIADIKMNGSLITDPNHTPNILNISIKGVHGEELVAMLDDQEIYVSTGSACNSDSKEPSHVLKAIGCSDEEANSSIRISLSNDTTLKEVNEFCEKLVYDIKILRN